MSYKRWGQTFTNGRLAFSERAFSRDSLALWDGKWQALSPAARSAYLSELKLPAKAEPDYGRQDNTGVPIARFPAPALKELTEAGFVRMGSMWGVGKSPADLVFIAANGRDFASRVSAAQRYHLLAADQPSMFSTYIRHCYVANDLMLVIQNVLQNVGITEFLRLDELLERYVVTHRWADWVQATLQDRLSVPIMKVVQKAAAGVPLDELTGMIKGAKPEAVRSSLDDLIAHMVLVEDLDPGTLGLRVGVLPVVRDQWVRALEPRSRPPLVTCASPKEVGPDESYLVGDLRAVLLEVASDSPRLRQNHSLFQKEFERFVSVLEPLPAWMSQLFKLTPEGRLSQAFQWARYLKLVKDAVAGKVIHLRLSPEGEKWLVGSLDDQCARVFRPFLTPTTQADMYSSDGPGFMSGFGASSYSDYSGHSDRRFLGVNVVSLPVVKPGTPPHLWETKPKDLAALRGALYRAFSALPLGVYHRFDSFVGHTVFGEYNPMLLGKGSDLARVVVYWNGRPVPSLPERIEEAARHLLEEIIGQRLLLLGCLRMAVDDQGKLCIAREPRLDAYFGRPITAASQSTEARLESKVVVQPDFSVVIIGTSPAPAAELIPFCERTSPGSGRGALVLKLTRDAVVQAISQGLPPGEILVRLKRHASHELPANVVREVEGWTTWVRSVALERLAVLRCPDRETADRVMAALRKQAERVHDTLVAISPDRLSTQDRLKLQGQGVIVASVAAGLEPRPKAKKKASRKRRF